MEKKIFYKLTLIIIIFMFGCESTQQINSPLEAVKSKLESKMFIAMESGDLQKANSIKLCLGSIQGLESENSKLRSDLMDCNSRNTLLDNQFKKLMEDYAYVQNRAGRADMIDSQFIWISILFVFFLIASVIFLIYSGKIRIPGFLG